MDNARQQIVDSIKKSSNILVTVSSSPSVDELSAALGLSIILNNMDKRATAIFSGNVPHAIEFLEPGKTFESSADSLRDFIIALNKEKADHLRYKVDGDVVKIFITPYKTTLSQADLEFSQGDYNVDLVVALGVKDQDHLDKALEAHGKILHDATVVTVGTGNDGSKLGSIDWHDGTVSSLSEMIVSMSDALKGEGPILDQQIATALLTGIVSATARFSNDHTTSRAMTMAAQLMAAGANQQLIAAKLEEGNDISSTPAPKSAAKPKEDSASELSIDRTDKKEDDKPSDDKKPEEKSEDKPAEAKPEEKSNEETAQKELEKELAGLTAAPVAAAPTETLEDIENELKKATAELGGATAGDVNSPKAPDQPAIQSIPAEPEPAKEATPPEAPVSPMDMKLPPLPVFDSPELSASKPTAPEPAPTESPQIVNEHGTMSAPPSGSLLPPINSIQTNALEGEPAAVDPFAQPIIQQKVGDIAPPASDQGTPEGAAILASSPALSLPPLTPVAASEPTPAPAQPEPLTIPELPPLPPLPPDISLPPLPPPPPPPTTFGQPPVGGAPSGAVSGDVFGDGASAAPPAPATPPEPGQFKIPGQ